LKTFGKTKIIWKNKYLRKKPQARISTTAGGPVPLEEKTG
jgi:hypothetical protein